MIKKGQVDSKVAARFAADLDRLVRPADRLGIAVSGGADSLALLLLSATVRPGMVEAATVDHRFRPESADEAAFVNSICENLGVAHATLHPDWAEVPGTAIQEKARTARYAALGRWAEQRGLEAIATGHQSDDQAETFLMRLSRGAGVRGLAGMRPSAALPGVPGVRLVRPVLDWRRAELEAICAQAGYRPVQDPSNSDERFERVRTRRALADCAGLDATAISLSCANLALAEDALEWAARREWDEAVERNGDSIVYHPSAPAEIKRRVIAAILSELGTEGGAALRGKELDRLLDALESEGVATLRGVRCSGGALWRFAAAPRRKPRPSASD